MNYSTTLTPSSREFQTSSDYQHFSSTPLGTATAEPVKKPQEPVDNDLSLPPPVTSQTYHLNQTGSTQWALPPGWKVAYRESDGKMYYWEVASGLTVSNTHCSTHLLLQKIDSHSLISPSITSHRAGRIQMPPSQDQQQIIIQPFSPVALVAWFPQQIEQIWNEKQEQQNVPNQHLDDPTVINVAHWLPVLRSHLWGSLLWFIPY